MFRILRRLISFFFISSILAVIAFRYVPVYVTPLMVIRCIQQKIAGKPVKLEHKWVPLNEMSHYLPIAVMASEDQRFMKHHGFDVTEIRNAAIDRITGRRFRGGSTISQQTAKNVFLWPQSSWIRKGFEAYFTVLIEIFWSKQRIMEVYLNSIEMGDGIYGAQAVASCHFNCRASELSKRQCALIAATLPNPLHYSSLHPSKYVNRRKTEIITQMKHVYFCDLEDRK